MVSERFLTFFLEIIVNNLNREMKAEVFKKGFFFHR